MNVRASSLDRLLTCGASHRLIAAVEPTLLVSRDNKTAARGTAIHTAAHAKLIAEHGATPPEEGHTADAELYHALPPYDRWTARYYIDHILRHAEGMALLVEQELRIKNYDLRSNEISDTNNICVHPCSSAVEKNLSELTGHIDCFAITADGTRAHIFDLKAGHDPVDPADLNWQILGYIVLLYCTYPTLREIAADIVQPALDADDRVSTTVVAGRDALDHAKNDLFRRIGDALTSNTLNSDTLRQCRYCPAAHRCHAFKQEFQNTMQLALTETELERAGKPDLAKLVTLKLAAGRIEQPLENARLELVEYLKRAGGAATLPDGRSASVKTVGGKRFFRDPVLAKQTFKELPGLTPEDRAKAVDINITNLEAVVAERHDLPEVSKNPNALTAKQWLKDRFGDNLDQATTKRIYIK